MTSPSQAFFTEDSRSQLDDLLMLVCEELQLAPSRYQLAVQRYESVSRVLEGDGSPFKGMGLCIYPQGSMALGTTVRPLEGPHDLDFVFELEVSHYLVDPMRLLMEFYGFLKGHGVYKDLVSLKNRCVRLSYANEFYMDLLPACKDYALGGTCIQVPDRKLAGWSPSNPKGFARWFRAASVSSRGLLLEKAAEPVPRQQEAEDKLPLQLTVQLMKRWRDLYYNGVELAPISIVLTSLAGRTYGGEESTSVTLSAVLDRIVSAIHAADLRGERLVIANPSNELEDLSERWDNNPGAYEAFKTGMRWFHQAWQRTLNAGRETNRLLQHLFGEPVQRAVVKQAQRLQEARRSSQLGVRPTGTIALAAPSVVSIRPNTFHGAA
jgi:hypothetical protein